MTSLLIQQARIGLRILQIPEDVGGNAGHAVDANVRQGFMPAGLLFDFGPQSQRARLPMR
ncbi:hypothetical protein AU509_01370 [Lonsdalea britannica]|nr:hypothetical protein AU509_01370 [Lonsdalea britannica]